MNEDLFIHNLVYSNKVYCEENAIKRYGQNVEMECSV